MVASSPSFGEHRAEERIHHEPPQTSLLPRSGQTVTVKYNAAGAPARIPLYGAAHSFEVHKPTFEAVAVTYDVSASSIAVVVNEDSHLPLEFPFIYRPDQGFAPIHETTEALSRNKRIKAFYWRLWFDQNQALPEGVDLHDELVGPEVTITAAAIERFCDVVGNQAQVRTHSWGKEPATWR